MTTTPLSVVKNPQRFFAHLRRELNGLTQGQVDGINRTLTAWERYAPKGFPLAALAYVLATKYWETATTMEPVRETKASSSAEAVRRLEAAWRAGKLKWVKTRYWLTDRNGQSPHGRGDVQLTHAYNYEKADQKLNMKGALVKNYDLAMEPDTAARIAVVGMLEGWFTGKKLSDYFRTTRRDFRGARRIINGTDKAAVIASIAEDFYAALVQGN